MTQSLTSRRSMAAVIALVVLLVIEIAPAAARAAAGTLSSTISVKSSRPEAHYGDPGQITATVKAAKAGAGVPSGEVEFLIDGTLLWSETLEAKGKATIPLSFIYGGFPPATYTITAAYTGDEKFAPSTSTTITQTLIGRTSEAVSALTLNEKGAPVFSPKAFSLRYQDPFSCNVAIHNETPNAYQVLYGTPGSWKALRYVIPANGVAGVGVGLEHFTGYFTVRGAANYIRIACK